MNELLPYLYAPIRASLHGPTGDSFTIALLVVPVDVDPEHRSILVRVPLLGGQIHKEAGHALDALEEEAMKASVERAASADALIDWWNARSAARTDFVYLAPPMAGAAADLAATAAELLAAYTAR